MSKTILIILILLSSSIAFAGKKTYGNINVTKVVSVYDGDTIRVNLEFYPAIIGENMGIRIAGIDTPEMHYSTKKIKRMPREKRAHALKRIRRLEALAVKAKRFAAERLKNGLKIELRNMRRGKYFRIVAEVWIDGKNLGRELINAGLAKRYDGGRKTRWK